MVRKAYRPNEYGVFEEMPAEYTGIDVLHNPSLNKGTAFTYEERDRLKLRGLLPPRVFSQDEQVHRVLVNLRRKSSDLDKYIYLTSLQDRNEALFFRVVMEHLDEIMPIIYTPTVGQACQEYGHIFRRPRGLFISLNDVGHMKEIMQNWYSDDVRVIVVTDGERILGLGDLGANGMGIPVGKLALYTACAGIHPSHCLPITLDVGTNNMSLREDPLYIGLQQERVRGDSFDAFFEEFVQAVHSRYPNALIQLEDFGNINAFRLLQNYRTRACVFDDDIQGTAAVTLAGIQSALRITKGKMTDQKFLIYGAGEAGIGIGELLVTAMERSGMSHEDAMKRCFFVDSKGLIVKGRGHLNAHKEPFAHEAPPLVNLLEIVDYVKPTALIGVSGQPNTFTEHVLRHMAALNERPIIFALSNPTSKSECTAEQAYQFTDGRAIFASGSPFPPVTFEGKTIMIGQANNAYIFPGVGLGVIASGAKHVTDEMFYAAAQALSDLVSEEDLALGRVYPALQMIRQISVAIATAVARVAFADGLTDHMPPANLEEHIRGMMYDPRY